MHDPSKINQELIEENTLLRQRIQELERSESERKRANDALRESEERFRAFMDNMPSMVIIKDKELRPLFFNRKFSEMFPAKEWLGKTPEETFPPEIAESMRANDLKALLEGFVAYEEEWLDKDGNLRVLETRKFPIDQKDKAPLLGAIITDNTDRRQAEEDLRLMNLFQDSILENIPDMIFIKDAGELRFVRFNRAGEDLLGYSRDQLLGKNDYDFFPKEQADFFTENDREVLHGKKVLDIPEESIQTSNKGERILHTKKVPILNAKGEPSYLLGISEDITDRKLSEEKLKAAKEIYRNIFMNSQTGLFRTDIETGMMLEANDSMARFAGYENREELLSSNFNIAERYIDPEARSKMLALVKEYGQCSNYEALFRRNDGSLMWIRLSAKLVPDKRCLEGVAEDITDRKKMEDALRESEGKYRLMAENMADIISVMDMNLHFTYISPSIMRVRGFTAEEVMDQALDQIMTPESLQIVLMAFDEEMRLELSGTADPDRIRVMELEEYKKDGDLVCLESNMSFLRDKDCRPVAILAVSRDITKRKNMEERLQRAEKMEALGVMAGGVAHDMNNVLGILVGYSELLLRELPEGSRAGRYAKSILQGGERAAAIIQDLLTMARRGVSVSEVVNLNQIVADSFKTPEFELVKSHHPDILFRSHVEKDLFNIKGSPVHLSKTIMNLISNAAESIRGAGEVTITTENRYVDLPIPGYENTREGEYVVLTVMDTGSGISPTDMGRIFEPFYTKKIMGRSGTGLGLAVVWGTVKDHSGYIDVRTKENKGSTFTLYFPVTRDALSMSDQALSQNEYRGRGEAILVVDDVEDQRLLAATILEGLNYRVATVANGEDAVKYLRTNNADLIVLDMIMEPGIDGLETYRRIMEIQPRQRAIIVSGFAKTERVSRAQELGAGEYVMKPYVIEKIGAAIRKELDRI